MSTVEPLNTLPIQQFISSVKSADAGKQREIKLNIDTAKRLAFTLGEVMARLEGDLEKLVKEKNSSEDTVVVQLGSNKADWSE